jgi:hypothetical protein
MTSSDLRDIKMEAWAFCNEWNRHSINICLMGKNEEWMLGMR